MQADTHVREAPADSGGERGPAGGGEGRAGASDRKGRGRGEEYRPADEAERDAFEGGCRGGGKREQCEPGGRAGVGVHSPGGGGQSGPRDGVGEDRDERGSKDDGRGESD